MTSPPNPPTRPRRARDAAAPPAVRDVYFVLLPGVMLLDFAGTAETLQAGVRFGAPLRLHFVGPGGAARSSVGLSVAGVRALPRRLPRDAIVIVPGAEQSLRDFATPQAEEVVRWLARSVKPSHLLCTVCSGIFLAARSGLADGRRCTTHHTLTARLAQSFAALEVVDNRILVRDGNLLSGAGVTAGIDLALCLLTDLAGPRAAAEVARHLVVYFRRSEGDEQLSPWVMHRNHVHAAVHKVQDWVSRSPAHPWTTGELARRAGVSERHLTRLFRSHAGVAPSEYVRHARVALARALVQTTDQRLEQIATTSGFSSAAQMRRAWRQRESTPPVHLRRAGAGRKEA